MKKSFIEWIRYVQFNKEVKDHLHFDYVKAMFAIKPGYFNPKTGETVEI